MNKKDWTSNAALIELQVIEIGFSTAMEALSQLVPALITARADNERAQKIIKELLDRNAEILD